MSAYGIYCLKKAERLLEMADLIAAMSFDALSGAAFGVAGQGYNALRIAGMSSVDKGIFASNLASQQLGSSVINKEVSVMSGGARPRLDFLTQSEGGLFGFEAKYGNASLTSAQTRGYGAINAGSDNSLLGKNAINSFTRESLAGNSIFGVDTLRFGALDATPNFYNFLGGAIGGASSNGGFLLYPNKPNNNQMQSVYSK